VHDAQGRVTLRRLVLPSGGVRDWRYSWDELDRLVTVTTPSGERWRYRYDALGRRVAKERLGPDGGAVLERVEFAWDGVQPAEQRSGGRTLTWDWDPGGVRLLAQRERSRDAGRFHAVVTDLVGTPTELVDAEGRVLRVRTSLWGAAEAGSPTPLRFPGQYADEESGLHYNVLRHYDPAAGGYVSPDPLGLAAGPNHRHYVPNPLTWSDPLGLSPCSLREVRMALGRAGMSVRDYDIVHVPVIEVDGILRYGRSTALGDGSPVLGPRGRPLIEVSDLGLSSVDEAVTTIYHEIFHINSNIRRGHPGSEAAAEEFGRRMLDVFRRRRSA
jgi:RHS repeat-associated protein